MRDLFDNAYLIAARHSLLTPDTLGFAFVNDGEIFFTRSAESEIISLTDETIGDGKIIRDLFDSSPDKNAAVIMYDGFAYSFAEGGVELPITNRRCRMIFGKKVMCVPFEDARNNVHNPEKAYLVCDRFAIVFGADISDSIENAVALEYSARIAAITSFISGK